MAMKYAGDSALRYFKAKLVALISAAKSAADAAQTTANSAKSAAAAAQSTANGAASAANANTTALSGKVDKVSGKGLSTNDYTAAEKTKLGGIAAGAQVNTLTGVKGSAESGYRVGNVNITAANLGLGNVNNTADSAKSVASAASCSGNAATATALTSSAGEATRPIYFSGGKPVACTYTLGKSVPSDAKFTDTTYADMKGATTSAAGTHGLVPAPATGAATRYLRSDGTWQVPPDNNTTYGAATTSANGLMTSAMVTKLNGIATGANAYSLPTANGSTNGGVKLSDSAASTSGVGGGYAATPAAVKSAYDLANAAKSAAATNASAITAQGTIVSSHTTGLADIGTRTTQLPSAGDVGALIGYNLLHVHLQDRYNALNSSGYVLISSDSARADYYGKWSGLPDKLTVGTDNILYREVLYYDANNVMVRMTELRPTTGRIWSRIYCCGAWGNWNVTNVTSG